MALKNPFASGLGKGGRLASWLVAAGVVAAYSYFDSQKQSGSKDNGHFTSKEQADWNDRIKRSSSDRS